MNKNIDETRAILKKNIHNRRLALKRKGVEYCKSAEKFALYIGLNPKTYTNYEQQSCVNVPDYGDLVRIAKALKTTINDILDSEILFDYIPEKIDSFLCELQIKYDKKLINAVPCCILHVSPELRCFSLPSNILVEYSDMETIITEFNNFKINVIDLTIKKYVLFKYIIEYDVKRFDDLNNSAIRRGNIETAVKTWINNIRRLETFKKSNDVTAYFSFLEKMFSEQKKLTGNMDKDDMSLWHYGFKEFRGGKE